MMERLELALLLAAPGLPLLLAALLAVPAARRAALAAAPWAALPALAIALAGWPAGPLDVHWLLLGTTLELDALRRLFLGFTAGLWLAAGVYGRAYHAEDPARARVAAFFCATMAGNLLLVIAGDAVTFYLGFLVMSFAAYGLIVHHGDDEARRAGRVYLILVVAGETLILPALWLAVSASASIALADVARGVAEAGDAVFWLLAAGLGIKAALVPLHVWLPLAHPVAPTPSSAVLSGAMVKAGVLGWLVLLPMGDVARPDHAAVLIAAGFAGAFGAALAGVMQSRPKSVLAYSSVSQMGLVAIAFGIGLADPALAPTAVAAVAAYSLHHALAKGALFLGVGVIEAAPDAGARRRLLGLAALPALALAGVPLTSGIVAKTALKDAAYGMTGWWHEALSSGLPWAAVGTTALMARFLWLLARDEGHGARPGLFWPWAALLAAVATLSFLPLAVQVDVIRESFGPTALWAGIWPALLGVALAAWFQRHPWRGPRIPEGDVLWPVARLLQAAWAARPRIPAEQRARLQRRLAAQARRRRNLVTRAVLLAERALGRWPALTGGFLVAMLAAVALIAR